MNKRISKRRGVAFFCVVIALVIFSGCGGKSSREYFLREGVDLQLVRSVAVLPMENHSNDPQAHRRVRDILTTRVMNMGLFDEVTDKGIVDSRLAEEAINEGEPLDPVSLNRLGQRLNVQAFLLGSVDIASEQRKGQIAYFELALTLRLVEANSGLVLWQASGYRNGDTLVGRLLGLEPKDAYQVSLDLVDRLLSTM